MANSSKAESPTGASKGGTMSSLVLLFVLWYLFNAYYNVSNKIVVKMWFFPYSCAFLQVAIGLLYLFPSWASGMQKLPKLSWGDIVKLLPIVILHAGGHVSAVLSMSAGAVSFTHIIKASEPVASTLLGPFFGVARQPLYVDVLLLPIVGGVAYAAMKPGQGLDLSQLTSVASLYALTSNVFFALRGILSKRIMTADFRTTKNMDASNTWAVLTIITALILIFPAAILEGPQALEGYRAIEDKTDFLQTNLACGLTYYLYNEMGFRVLNRLDPVSAAVGNTVKRIVIMAATVMFLDESMTSNKLIGACVAVAGTLAYSLAKSSAAAAKKAKTA